MTINMTIEETYDKVYKRCGSQCEWETPTLAGGVERCQQRHYLRLSFRTKSKKISEENLIYLCPTHYQQNEQELRPPIRGKEQIADPNQLSLF